MVRRPDKTFEPITWKSYYDKIELVIYVASAAKFPDKTELMADLPYFEYFLSTGFFYDRTNTYANLPLMVMFDKGPTPTGKLKEIKRKYNFPNI